MDVKAVDNATNEATDTVTFTTDATNPAITITSPSEGTIFNTSSVTVTWTGSDNTSGIDHYEVRIDNGSWINVGMNTSHTFTGLSEGNHTVNVKAVDKAGNENTDSALFTIKSSTQGQDTDNDGIPDGWEEEHGLNPNNSSDAQEDSDGDGLTNLQEYEDGTDPQNNDTDSDGIPDGWEEENGLNPNNSSDAQEDIDNDGLTNLQEYKDGTNPSNPDTDGDGIPDGKDANPLAPSQRNNGGFPWLYVVLISIIVLVMAIVLYIFKKRKSPVKNDELMEENEDYSEEDEIF